MGIATQYEGGLIFDGDQMYITTGSSTIMTIKSGGTIQLPQYGAGILQTDASGNISVDTSTYLTSYTETDTLNSVVGRGSSTTSSISVGGITSGNATFNGTVLLGGFNGNNEDQWPIVEWYRDTPNGWDEGLIKASSNKGFFSTSHFGIHFDSSRAFGFFTSSWTKVIGINSSKVLSNVDVEVDSTKTIALGELRIGTHAMHTGYTGIWNTEASTTTTSQYLIISKGTDTFVNGDTVRIRPGNNDADNELKVATGTTGLTYRGNTVWTAENDGSGSGLDADKLDGINSGSFLRSDTSDSFNSLISYSGSAETNALDLNQGNIADVNDITASQFTQYASGKPRNNLGSPTVTEMALFESQFRCMTDLSNNYNDLTDLTFYKQMTSASEWEEVTTYSDDQKRRFLRTNNSGVVIPNTAYKFRVEFNAPGYVFANAMYFYWSSNSHNTQVHIWKQRASDDQWLQHTSSTRTVSSWPGHLYLPFNTIPWLENADSTSTGHYHKVRIEFTPNWSGHATYGTRDINLYGGQIWGGYPAGRRTPHYYDQNGKLFTWGDFEVNGKLYIDTRDSNTSSTTALVMNGNEVEQRTLGSAAFSTSTDFVAVSGDIMTGNLEIQREHPVVILDDTSATNTTNLIAYQTFQVNGTENGWLGYGSGGDSDLTVKNNAGRVVLNGSSGVYSATTLEVAGPFLNYAGAKIEVQNQIDGGNSRGIFMWDSTDSNWGIYMGQAGDEKSLAGTTASAGIDGATAHAIRFRVNDNSSQAGFIWENSSNEVLMQLNGGSEKLYTRNAIYPSNQTTDYVDSTRIQNWQTAYGWGNHASAGYLTSYTETDTLDSVLGRGNTTQNAIHIIETDNSFTFRTNENWGGWARTPFYFEEADGTGFGGFGAYGSNGATLSKYYIGTAYNDNIIEFNTSGVVEVTGGVSMENAIDVLQGRIRLGHHTSGAGTWYNTSTTDQYWFAGLDGNSFRLWRQGNRLEIANDGTLKLNSYGAGLLKTNSTGQVSLDTNTYLTSYTETDTLATVTGRGASTTTDISVRGVTARSIVPETTVAYDLGTAEVRWQIVFCQTLDSAGQHESQLQNPEGEKSVGDYATGTVLVWKGGKNIPCTESADHMRMGIAVNGIDSPLVQGAEPVLVTGSVNEGDYLVTSSVEGHAKAITPQFMRQHMLFDCVIGKALESGKGDSHLIKTWINI